MFLATVDDFVAVGIAILIISAYRFVINTVNLPRSLMKSQEGRSLQLKIFRPVITSYWFRSMDRFWKSGPALLTDDAQTAEILQSSFSKKIPNHKQRLYTRDDHISCVYQSEMKTPQDDQRSTIILMASVNASKYVYIKGKDCEAWHLLLNMLTIPPMISIDNGFRHDMLYELFDRLNVYPRRHPVDWIVDYNKIRKVLSTKLHHFTQETMTGAFVCQIRLLKISGTVKHSSFLHVFIDAPQCKIVVSNHCVAELLLRVVDSISSYDTLKCTTMSPAKYLYLQKHPVNNVFLNYSSNNMITFIPHEFTEKPWIFWKSPNQGHGTLLKHFTPNTDSVVEDNVCVKYSKQYQYVVQCITLAETGSASTGQFMGFIVNKPVDLTNQGAVIEAPGFRNIVRTTEDKALAALSSKTIILVGAHSVGKTTLAKLISGRTGAGLITETARTVMKKLVIDAADIKRNPQKSLQLQAAIIELQCQREREARNKCTIMDRCALDALVYAKTFCAEKWESLLDLEETIECISR